MGRPTQSGGSGTGRPWDPSETPPPGPFAGYEAEGGLAGDGDFGPDEGEPGGDLPPGHGGEDLPPGHRGGGLARAGDPFQRVYSPPEPPSQARRPKLLIVLVAVVAFAVAAAGVFLLVPTGGKSKAGPSETGPATPSGTGNGSGTGDATASETPRPSAPSKSAPAPKPSAKPFTVLSLPDACTTVSEPVLNRVVPGASKQPNANNTLATCTYTSKAPFRWLLVELYLFPSTTLPDAAGEASRDFGARWTQAHNTPLERTFALEQVPGLGDEAFRSFKQDRGQPLVVGEVTARRGNVEIRVGYSRQLPSGTTPESLRQSALANATDAAREVLAALR
ncbi:hypothetical protein [Actinomadura rupiterrae]|uniref:hypothetical protein n=1 Tax=Actinomadura rupiterrae TaxID=559627 RepID=UPI0020A265C5|nr:hypothetical protein [Actinomadura rupiterrae]MCP2334848.1 hypothetical protein [Actinomadura rupiterrae]